VNYINNKVLRVHILGVVKLRTRDIYSNTLSSVQYAVCLCAGMCAVAVMQYCGC